MTQLQITLHMTQGARDQLDSSSDSVCLTQQNNVGDSTTTPVWVSFYKGCPVGINSRNEITWTESWCADYSTKVWNQEGTLVTGSGDVSSDPKSLGHLSKLNSTLTLGSNGSWSEKVGGGSSMMNCINNHATKVTFVYYFKTSVNGAAPTTTGNPIYTSADYVSNGGHENVSLIQTVNIAYKGKSVKTGTIVASSGGDWTSIDLVTSGTYNTDITADYTDLDGWSFYAGAVAEFQLTESSDKITSLKQTNSSKYAVEGGPKITGKLGVQTAITVGVAAFILGSIKLTVTGQTASGLFFDFIYDGPATWATIATYLGQFVDFITKPAALARAQLKRKAQNKYSKHHHHEEDNRRKSIEDKKRQKQYYDDDEPRKWDQEDKRMRIDI